jgi:YD repeat-containing protein
MKRSPGSPDTQGDVWKSQSSRDTGGAVTYSYDSNGQLTAANG